MERMGRGKDFDNVLTTLQTPHLYNRMTVDLNNLVVSLWKQELTYVKICILTIFLTIHLSWCFKKVLWIQTVSDVVY